MKNPEFIEKAEHQAEITKSHSTGFGSSDAKMFYKVGLKGLSALSASDKKRIAIAMGVCPPNPELSGAQIVAGHLFEDFFAKSHDNWQREVLLEKQFAKNFRTFSHVDFVNGDDALELKFSQKTESEIIKTYNLQCQWHYMLGCKFVSILHGWGSVEPFGVEDTKSYFIQRNETEINLIKSGIQLVDEYVSNSDFANFADLQVTDLLPFEQSAMVQFGENLAKLKELEKIIENSKIAIKDMMEAYGATSLKGDNYTVTYIAESERYTFDKAKLLKEHPEINESDYQKKSKVKSCIKISVK